MSATLTPIETIEAPRPEVAGPPASAPVWHDSRPTGSTGRLGVALFVAAWAPALAVASAVAAIALVVLAPFGMARELYEKRRYR